MIHSRGANASDVEVVWAQLLQGWGGGFAVVATHVSSQASVPHADLALVSAIIVLWAEIGGAIGNAIGRPSSSFHVTFTYMLHASRCNLDERNAEESCEESASAFAIRARRTIW